jgi:hypothetical protein
MREQTGDVVLMILGASPSHAPPVRVGGELEDFRRQLEVVL